MNQRFNASQPGGLRRSVARVAKNRFAWSAFPIVIVLICAGFASRSASDEAARAAINRFWDVYHGNDYGAIPQVESELQIALQEDPGDPTLYALLGAAHFWHVGEAARDPNPHDPALAQDMPAAVVNFGQALELDYYSRHFIGHINDDHLPGYLGITTVHLGQMTSDPGLISRGDRLLDFGVYEFPEFNNFNRWAAHNTDAKDSPSYQKALNSLWDGLDACAGATVDRTDPDLKPYLNLVTSVGRKKTCWWEGDLAPYSFEGYMLNLGNGLVKAGQIQAARVMYHNAHYAANFETWPYRSVLEAIENADLDARAALYADKDPAKDPPLGVANRGCSYCHARVPEKNNPN